MDWFQTLFGFREAGYAETKASFSVQGDQLVSRVNGESFGIGHFETPSLATLRQRAAALPDFGPSHFEHIAVSDIFEAHARPEYQGALFQVASQFNCLEFMGPSVLPEHGVTGYQSDPTQGPACAMAAGAATVYRNYFAPVGDQVGQTRERQLDNLAELAQALGPGDPGWDVRNGYTTSTLPRLASLRERLAAGDREALLGHVRIGLQTRVEVTFSSRFRRPAPRPEGPPTCSQAFCSALSVAYSGLGTGPWAPLGTLALDAAYEATLLAAALDRAAGHGSGRVVLTFLGGGAFGNDEAWITAAIGRAVGRAGRLGLHIELAHYRRVDSLKAAQVDGAISAS
jgi:hypothetical protein